MKKHIRNICKALNIGEQDILRCEYCGAYNATDAHHIKFKSKGGTDDASNILVCCRPCHDRLHKKLKPYITEEQAREAIKYRDNGNS